MSSLRTGILAIALSCAAQSQAHATGDLINTFATCVGRLSAELEHQWLMHEGDPDQTARLRGSMIELLEVVSEDAPGPWILAKRIDAKFAHAALLQRASFNDNEQDARWALRRAQDEVAACRSLLLS